MPNPTYCIAGRHGYIFRMRVPHELHHIFGKRMLKKSLKTRDKLLATRRAIYYAIQANELFEQIRRGLSMAKPPFFMPTWTGKDITNGSVTIGEFSTDPGCTVEEQKELLDHLFKRLAAQAPPSSIVPTVIPVPAKSTCLTISQAIDAFCREAQLKNPKWDAPYLKKCVYPALNLLILALGDKAVSTITREDALRVFEVVQRLPSGLTKKPEFRGQSLDKVLAVNVKKQAPATIYGKMTLIQKFADWLALSDHTLKSYFIDLNIIGKSSPEKPRVPFNDEDLRTMFTNRLFTDLQMNKEYMYWLPLIALHTGMRLNEICQLRSRDIFLRDGVYLLDVTDDFEDEDPDDGSDYKNRLKTGASKRHVPVHQKLIDLGFLSFVEQKKDEIRLFKGLEERDKRLSSRPSRWFNERFRPEVGIDNTEMKVRKDFHSFRHTAIDTLKQARGDHRVVKSIVGHSLKLSGVSGNDITDDGYSLDFDAKVKFEVISMLDFSDALRNVLPWTGKITRGRRPRRKQQA